MRYEVELHGVKLPAYMVTCNGMVIHVTCHLHWALGHDFSDVHRILTKLNARWRITSLRTDKPRHGTWIDYTGTTSTAVIER